MTLTDPSTSQSPGSASALTAHWWIPLARGLVSIVFGIVVFAFPVSAIGAFVLMFGAFVLVDGILAVVQGLRSARPRSTRWWMHLAAGAAGIATGILTLAIPGITALALALLVSTWAILTGVLEIVAGVRLRSDVSGEIYLILAGVFSVVLGAIVFFFPFLALLSGVWIVGSYAIASGIALVVLALRLRPGDIGETGYGAKPR